jgi:H+-transporting ATPase
MGEPQNLANIATTTGLTGVEASRRLAVDGPNMVADAIHHPMVDALKKFWAPIPWMLEAAIVLQLAIGDYVEASVVALLLVFNAGLALFQENRAQATLDALKSRLAVSASVRRDGQWKNVLAKDLVKGDVVKLSLGAVVPADLRLIEGSVLVDQSMLTGESVPSDAGPGFVTYAGALIRRGEAVAEIIATGVHTKFGKTAELIRTAQGDSTEQKAIFGVVRNLAIFNGVVTLVLTSYAFLIAMPLTQIVPLVLVAVLASIPVALPSMFTLAATVGARALAAHGVLPTRLSALDEAAGIDILCVDKTGTLTRNELAVTECQQFAGHSEAQVLALAALASSDGGADPLDAAIRAKAASEPAEAVPWKLVKFTPFNPAKKMSEAQAIDTQGHQTRVVKGAFEIVAGISTPNPEAVSIVAELQAKGYRVLGVAVGAAEPLQLVGVIALSDPPRTDSAAMVAQLNALGVRTLMLTGDAPITARVVAEAVGIKGAIYSTVPLASDIKAEDFGVFAGVLPEDKYALVKSLQKSGHKVGMCGDGTNDAPALKQAQMGIAVLSATDVAKSAAGLVLTEQGLGGVVFAINEGRTTFQRILTYTLRSIIHKVAQVLFLFIGLVMTGAAVLTPLLMVLMMLAGDFFALSSSTDNVRASSKPNVWRIGNLTFAGIILGVCDLIFCTASLGIGRFGLGLDNAHLQTLTVITLVFSGQAVFYVSRERRHLWNSVPGKWLLAGSALEIGLFSTLATQGILMSPLPIAIVAGVVLCAALLALVLDLVKVTLFSKLAIA